MQVSTEHSRIDARNVGPLVMSKADCENFQDLNRLGIGITPQVVHNMMKEQGYMDTMDDLQGGVTVPSITTPVQFLQNWLPGYVQDVTAARKIDELVGITTSGSWEDEEIVQGIMEYVGSAVVYGDYTNVPFSSWNTNYERRTVVRFEEGMRVGSLEEARAGRIQVNSGQAKRAAAARSLEIVRNRVGFFGYNNGNNRTYGFLNDPELPAYIGVPVGGGGQTFWSTKTFLEITADIRTAIVQLRTQSRDVIDPETTEMTLALPTAAVDRLSTTSDFGNSVRDWLTTTYPKIRVVSAPELDAANGGDNVFYLYAEKVADESTDDNRTFIQVVPTKMNVLGVQKLAKGYEEDYSNATAGIMLKRPWAVVRYSGI